ncbi:restriction endonuclease subunit S [Enterococcus sp. C50]|uniref:restriction endonuclease subunit S n=1 Tax=Enterococcus sp. C50 TaxID=3231311 RepID=UPI0034A0A198
MVDKRVPELRFEGFDGDWEQRKLGDLGSVAMNKRIFKDQTSDNGEVPFFKIGTFGSYPDAFISRELFEEYKSKYPYPEVGDILISASGSIGRTVVYQGEDEYFQDSNIVWLKHNGRLDNKFLQQFYSIVNWQGIEGSTIKRLYNKNILDTNIRVPTLDEQNKLGAFFEQLDDTIALHQQKLDQLKRLKQGLLQILFGNKEPVPKVRFAGFDEEWEQRKFKELSTKQGKKNSQGLDFPAYSVSNKVGLIAQTDQFDGSRLDDLEKTSYKFVEPKEFAYNPARINVGSIAFNNLNKKVIVSSLYVVVKMSDDLDNEFILQYIKSPIFIKEVRRNTEGSVREYLFYENFANIKVPYTKSIEEQRLIGMFFKQLDNTINLHQTKLEKLKQLKQAFLQSMFI